MWIRHKRQLQGNGISWGEGEINLKIMSASPVKRKKTKVRIKYRMIKHNVDDSKNKKGKKVSHSLKVMAGNDNKTMNIM